MRHVLKRLIRAGKIRAGGTCFLVAALLPAAAEAAATLGKCSPTAVSFAASILDSQTSSISFVQVPEAVRVIVQGGTKPSCVIVNFDADVAAGVGTDMIIRATIDGSATGAVPTLRRFSSDGMYFQSHSGSFIFPSVAPGNHAVRIQYYTVNGNAVYLSRGNLIIHHTP